MPLRFKPLKRIVDDLDEPSWWRVTALRHSKPLEKLRGHAERRSKWNGVLVNRDLMRRSR